MKGIVYTIGHTMQYDTELQLDHRSHMKIGREDAGNGRVPDWYQGGIVFETPELAKKYIKSTNKDGYAVYEVAADWETDCEINEQDGEKAFWKHLIVTSRIMRKVFHKIKQ